MDINGLLRPFGGFWTQNTDKKDQKWTQFGPKNGFPKGIWQQVKAGKVHFWSQKYTVPPKMHFHVLLVVGGFPA